MNGNAPQLREVSIIIKALNEEKNIERTLRSALKAIDGLDAEVILADSLSKDSTVDIAKRFPVSIVQLTMPNDRCCGVGAQLGYQYARGKLLLIIDGDMELEREWLLAAIKYLADRSDVAGVGGIVDDVNLDNIEFRARQQRRPVDMQPGIVDRLNMGGLYRRSAIEQVGYFTHRSLHACEELELGLRLTQAKWIMARIDVVSIHHYGHTIPIWTLIRRRWNSAYINGSGELLRTSFGQPWFMLALASQRFLLGVLGWLFLVTCLAVGVIFFDIVELGFLVVPVMLLPPFVMTLRKRSIVMGLYSVLSWCIDAAGMMRGFLLSPKNPREVIPSKIIKSVEL